MRALIAERSGESEFLTDRFFGHSGIEEFFNELSGAVAQLPWITLFPCLLRDVIPSTARDRDFFLIDAEKKSLPYDAKDPYQLYALAGGRYTILEKPTRG